MKNIVLLILVFYLIKIANSQHSIDSNSENFKNINSGNESLIETKFERISIDEGETLVYRIFQLKNGLMWFNINFSWYAYNGFTFKASDIIGNIFYEDNEGIIWSGTQSGRLLKYNNDEERFININPNGIIPSDNSIQTIIEDKNGNLIIGTSKNGIKLYDKKENKIRNYFNEDNTLYNLFSKQNIRSLLLIDNEILLIGTGHNGLYKFDNRNQKIINYKNDSSDKKSLSNNLVQNIFKDSWNNIWIGTANGLNLFNVWDNNFIVFLNDPGSPKSISDNFISAICEDKNNEIWIGTKNGGLNKFEKDKSFTRYRFDKNDHKSLSNDIINCLLVDRSNVLWIGTEVGGISKLDCQRKKFYTISNIFKNIKNNFNTNITSIFEDSEGMFWIGSANDGLFKFIKNRDGLLKFKEYSSYISDSLINSPIGIIREDKYMNLWMPGHALIEYYKKRNTFEIYKFPEYAYTNNMVLKDSILIISTINAGLLYFNIVKKKFFENDSIYKSLRTIPKVYMNTIYLDNNNSLWVGTRTEGLFEYKFDIDSLINYRYDEKDSNSISNSGVCAIYEDGKGNLWFGQLHGFNKFIRSEKKFKRYGIMYGVTSYISTILEDNVGFIWLSSSEGLYKFDPEYETIRHYDRKDGVPKFHWGNDNGIKHKDGTLYFGGSEGLTYFNPEEIKDNPYIPNIVFTDFQILNQSVKPSPENPYLKKSIAAAKEINLSYKESVFSFEFAALIYNNPSKNQYAYIMEGFDKDWVYCGTKRNATYTNLDPGDYIFRIKGSNNDGIWNEEGTSIIVTISPPWWQTWWFKSCGAGLILLIIGFGFKKRINKLKKEKKAQEEFSKKLLNSQEEERKKIASVLHDSIAHDVLITKNSSEIGLRIAGENEELKKILNKISEQSSSSLNELRRIQFNLHPYEVEKLGLTKAIKSIVDRVSKSTEIEFTIEEDFIDKTFSEENEIHLYRIIQESINNIIKHSSATEATIKINRSEEKIFISISDNGKGFSKSKGLRKNSMGLSGISERVKLLGGNLEIQSEAENGTILKISLPIV